MNYLYILFYLLFSRIPIHGYVSKCVISGPKCSDCEHLIYCVKTPEEGFVNHQISYCNNTLSEYCSVQDGGCVSDIKVCKIFGLQELDCQGAGKFPDPYDCTAYHLCTMRSDGSYTSVRTNCPDHRAFDPLSGTCRFKSNHRVCLESPVPKCVKPLQSDALKENRNMYYVCIKTKDDLIPLLYKCHPGQEYENNACVEYTSFTCTMKGRFKDSQNCYKYYDCHSDLSYVHKMCRPGSYFEEKDGICVKGTCYKN